MMLGTLRGLGDACQPWLQVASARTASTIGAAQACGISLDEVLPFFDDRDHRNVGIPAIMDPVVFVRATVTDRS